MDWRSDLESIVERLAGIGVDVVYGECLHVRGNNLQLLEERGIVVDRGALHSFDRQAGALFHQLLRRYGLKGAWWYEYG
jgi:DNA repair photolyase